jgi:hypothetical protein
MQPYRQRILQILYEKQARDSLQALDSEDLAREMGLSWEQIRLEVAYLEGKGYIVSKSRQIRTRIFRSLYLTAKGVDWNEGRVVDEGISEARITALGYHLKNIRILLNEGFTDQELRRLCYEESNFRPVYDELSQETGKAKIIDNLLEYAERKLLLDYLLALIKERNPDRYEKHQPYHV